MNAEASQELADGDCLDENDGLDEKCQDIEETLNTEFNIELSYSK